MIAAERALILWETDMSGAVGEILVCDVRARPHWSNHVFEDSAGASGGDWLRGAWYETPLGVYASLATAGFRSRADKVNALREFSKIEGQDWPEHLLSSLGEILGGNHGEAA